MLLPSLFWITLRTSSFQSRCVSSTFSLLFHVQCYSCWCQYHCLLKVSSSCQLPHRSNQSIIWDVMVLIDYFHCDLSWRPNLVNGHSKDLLCGCVIAFRYSVSNYIAWPIVMHDNDYTLASIWKKLIQLSKFWVNFNVLVITSMKNLSSSLWVGSIGGFFIHNCTLPFQITSHNM